MIKVNGTTVEYEGKGSNLIAECALAVAGTANAIANGDNNSAEAALYSVFMGAVRTLREECNTDIDTWIVGNQIANETKE